ncbi:hypothetical protein NSERUTF1_7412 [Nocardia seriolae]|nr:hypothetical protein NSERUTF1_7412 [Nocardia seriolae]
MPLGCGVADWFDPPATLAGWSLEFEQATAMTNGMAPTTIARRATLPLM